MFLVSTVILAAVTLSAEEIDLGHNPFNLWPTTYIKQPYLGHYITRGEVPAIKAQYRDSDYGSFYAIPDPKEPKEFGAVSNRDLFVQATGDTIAVVTAKGVWLDKVARVRRRTDELGRVTGIYELGRPFVRKDDGPAEQHFVVSAESIDDRGHLGQSVGTADSLPMERKMAEWLAQLLIREREKISEDWALKRWNDLYGTKGGDPGLPQLLMSKMRCYGDGSCLGAFSGANGFNSETLFVKGEAHRHFSSNSVDGLFMFKGGLFVMFSGCKPDTDACGAYFMHVSGTALNMVELGCCSPFDY